MSCFLVPPADVTIVQVPCNCECDVSSSCLKMASFAFHLWWDSAWQTPITSSCMFVCLLVLMHNLSQLSHYPSLGREVRIYQLLSHQLESFFSLLVFLSCPHCGDPQQPPAVWADPLYLHDPIETVALQTHVDQEFVLFAPHAACAKDVKNEETRRWSLAGKSQVSSGNTRRNISCLHCVRGCWKLRWHLLRCHKFWDSPGMLQTLFTEKSHSLLKDI